MYTKWRIRSLCIKYSRLHFSSLLINFRCKCVGTKLKSAFWFSPFLFQPSISHAAGNRQTNYVSDDIKWKIIRIFSSQRYMQHAAWSMQHLPSPNAFINEPWIRPFLHSERVKSHESSFWVAGSSDGSFIMPTAEAGREWGS